MSEEDFRKVGIPALRAKAELAAGGDKTRFLQMMQAFQRPVANAAGAALDVLDWFGQNLSAAGAGTESLEMGDKQRTIKTQLRAVADDDIDPIRVLASSSAGKKAEQALYDVAGSFGYMATVAVPGGIAVSLAGYQDSNKAQLMMSHPEMSSADAGLIGAAAAPIQTALDRLSLKLVAGKLPVLSSLLTRAGAPGGNAAVRFALYGAGSVGTEYTAEKLQEAAPLAMQSALAALKSDVPGADWRGFEVMDERTFWGVLPQALLGAGVNTVRDQATARRLVQDSAAMEALGLKPDAIGRIQTAADPLAVIQTEWAKRTPLEGEAAKQQWQDYSAKTASRQEAMEANMEREGITFQKTQRDGADIYRVTQGEITTEHADPGSAYAAVMDHMGAADAKASGPALEMLDAMTARRTAPTEGADVTLNQEAKSVPAWLAERYNNSENPDLTEPQRRRAKAEFEAMQNRMDIYEKANPDEATDWNLIAVRGQSGIEQTKEGVYKAVIKLSNGADVETVFEEFVESDLSAFLATGQATEGRMLSALAEVEHLTGDAYLLGHTGGQDAAKDTLALKEAYSKLAHVFVRGQSRAGQKDTTDVAFVSRNARQADARSLRTRLVAAMNAGQLNAELVASLKRAAEWMKATASRAIRLNRARRAAGGTLAIDEFLNKSIGLEADATHARDVVAEAKRIYGQLESQPTDNESQIVDDDGPGFSLKARTDKPSSWEQVRPGHSWNSAKQYLPATGVKRPGFGLKKGSWDQIVTRLASWLGIMDNPIDPWGAEVVLAYPEQGSMEARAQHLTGRAESGGRVRDDSKLEWLGAIVPTIKEAQVRVVSGAETLYFRRYNEGTHMVVVADGAVSDQYVLITQYAPDSKKRFEGALMENTRLAAQGRPDATGLRVQSSSSNAVDGSESKAPTDSTPGGNGQVSFRLAPIATLDRLAADIERRKRDPEARRKIYDSMLGALNTLRNRWNETQQRWNGESRSVVEQKSKKELDKEQAFREAMAYEAAEESIYDTLTPSAQAALGMTGEDTSAFGGVLAQRFSGKRFGTAGRIMGRGVALNGAALL